VTNYREMDVLELSCLVFEKILGWKKTDSLYTAPRADKDGKYDWFDTSNPLTYRSMPADDRDACNEAERKIQDLVLWLEYVQMMHLLAQDNGCRSQEMQDWFLLSARPRHRCVAMLTVLDKAGVKA